MKSLALIDDGATSVSTICISAPAAPTVFFDDGIAARLNDVDLAGGSKRVVAAARYSIYRR
jgi:hypothetical protein